MHNRWCMVFEGDKHFQLLRRCCIVTNVLAIIGLLLLWQVFRSRYDKPPLAASRSTPITLTVQYMTDVCWCRCWLQVKVVEETIRYIDQLHRMLAKRVQADDIRQYKPRVWFYRERNTLCIIRSKKRLFVAWCCAMLHVWLDPTIHVLYPSTKQTKQQTYYLRQRRRKMFLPVFVCLSVCLSVSKITNY